MGLVVLSSLERAVKIEEGGTGGVTAGAARANLGLGLMLGMIYPWAGNTIPNGFAPCQGQLLAVSEYPDLFDILGTLWGGDGDTTFGVPNLRGTGLQQKIIRVTHDDVAVASSVINTPASIIGPGTGYYKEGSVLSFTVQLLDDIAITGGPVSLSLDIGASSHTLAFTSGTAREWVFDDYTVQSGDTGEVSAALNFNGAALSSGGVLAVLNVGSTVVGTVDTTVPTVTFSGLSFYYDSGSSATDFIVSKAFQWIGATLSAELSNTERAYGSLNNGATWVDITDNIVGTALYSWAVTLAGSSTLKLKVVDLAGNDGDVFSQDYVLDTTAPVVPTVTSLTTNDTTPTIVGTATVGDGEVLTVKVGTITYTAGGANLTLSGTDWTLNITTALAIGNYSVTAWVTDTAGNTTVDTHTGNNLVITA